MHDKILHGAQKISALLNVEFSYSPANHNFELGLPLENALRTFFRPFFPSRYGFSSGYLVDKNGHSSNQIDWIIYDAVHAAPIIPRSTEADNLEWFPADCVYGTVEVKRSLDAQTLRTACEQIAKTKQLYREPAGRLHLFPYFDLERVLPHSLPPRQCNYLYNGIYAFQIKAGSELDPAGSKMGPYNFIRSIDSIAADLGYELMPDFLAVHGWFYLKKGFEKDGNTIFDTAVARTDQFVLMETGQNTAGIFYLDLLAQFADTLLSLNYQRDTAVDVLRRLTGGTVWVGQKWKK